MKREEGRAEVFTHTALSPFLFPCLRLPAPSPDSCAPAMHGPHAAGSRSRTHACRLWAAQAAAAAAGLHSGGSSGDVARGARVVEGSAPPPPPLPRVLLLKLLSAAGVVHCASAAHRRSARSRIVGKGARERKKE